MWKTSRICLLMCLVIFLVASIGTRTAKAQIDKETEGQVPFQQIEVSGSYLEALQFSPDEHMVASAHRDGEIWMARVADGKILWHAQLQRIVADLKFSPDGNFLVVLEQDVATLGRWKTWVNSKSTERPTTNSARVLDVRSGETIRTFSARDVGPNAAWRTCGFSDDGTGAVKLYASRG